MPRTLPLRPGLKLGSKPGKGTNITGFVNDSHDKSWYFSPKRSLVPPEVAAFSGGSVQVSVRPQTAAIPAAVPTMHRYCASRETERFSTIRPNRSTTGVTEWRPLSSRYLFGSACSCLLAHPVPSLGTSETLGSLPLFSAFRLGRLAGGGIRRAEATLPRDCRPWRGGTDEGVKETP